MKVAPCSIEAARYAVENWHYSGVLPTGKLVKYGLWEEGTAFKGAVIFGRGASPYLLNRYGLDATEGCELVRVAFRHHTAPVSQVIAETLRMLKRDQPGLRVVVSFADPKEGHSGRIYQAGNWIYAGISNSTTEYRLGGRWVHTRGAYWHPDRNDATPSRTVPGKYRYLYPLDKAMRRSLRKLSLPYPADQGLNVSRSLT